MTRKMYDLRLLVSLHLYVSVQKSVDVLIRQLCQPYRLALHLEPLADLYACKATFEIPLQSVSRYRSAALDKMSNVVALLRAHDRRVGLQWMAEIDVSESLTQVIGPFGGREKSLGDLVTAMRRQVETDDVEGLPEWVFDDAT